MAEKNGDSSNGQVVTHPDEQKAEDKSETNGNGIYEDRLATITPILGLPRLEKLKDEIQAHYIASLVYSDLSKNLTDRDKILDEFKEQLQTAKEEIKNLRDDQIKVRSQVDQLAEKQQECLKEYQSGAQELEEEVAEIDRQILELQRRKNEIAEMQEARLKDQDTTQTHLQNQIDQLEKEIEALNEKEQESENQLKLIPVPESLAPLDRRINDMIHHICTIFAPDPIDHPAAEVATRHTSPGLTMPPIFQLDPWAADENKGLNNIAIPIGAKHIILSLNIPGDKNFERYSAELYASNGRRVWNSDKLEVHVNAVIITFNSTFFLTDDYEMRLRGRNSERTYTSIAEYYFHITKG